MCIYKCARTSLSLFHASLRSHERAYLFNRRRLRRRRGRGSRSSSLRRRGDRVSLVLAAVMCTSTLLPRRAIKQLFEVLPAFPHAISSPSSVYTCIYVGRVRQASNSFEMRASIKEVSRRRRRFLFFHDRVCSLRQTRFSLCARARDLLMTLALNRNWIESSSFVYRYCERFIRLLWEVGQKFTRSSRTYTRARAVGS